LIGSIVDVSEKLKHEFENFFKLVVTENCPESFPGLKEMVSYHFGWDGSSPIPSKRLRPTFLLLTYASLTGAYQDAFLAASAMEVLHNYTLIHDDIEDQGEERHGHPALWKVYGIPLAINVGDYLSSLSQCLIGNLPSSYTFEIQKKAIQTFQKAALEVIQGQQLDISYEDLNEINISEYLEMIRLKTARLFAGSFSLAAILAGYEEELVDKLESIGEKLGLGFQIQDDYLGIWGQQLITGKSVSTDLLTRKKTYPSLVGLGASNSFRNLWQKTNQFAESDLLEMKKVLEDCGAKRDSLEKALGYFVEAQTMLNGVLATENTFSQALLGLLTTMFSPTLVAFSE